jgi:hypothetical protein
MVSEAERAYRALEPINLQRHSDHLRGRLVKIGALDPGDTTHPRYPDMFGSPLHEGLSRVAADVAGALVQLGFAPQRVAALVVGLTANDRFVARYRAYDDDSGLVLVSDSMVALCGAYGEYLGRVFTGGALRMLGRVLLSRWTGSLGEDSGLLAGILRYQILHRRLYGVAATLNFVPRPDDELGSAVRDVFLEFGLRFTVGHEAAHHVLAHRVTASVEERQEQDADTLALFLAAAAFEQESASQSPMVKDRWRQEASEFHGLLGALITMLAVHCSEVGLFIRNGGTHQPSEIRATQLIEHILSPERQAALERILGYRDPRMEMRFDKDRGSLQVYLHNMAVATQAAVRFDPESEAFDWTAFAAAPQIEQPPVGHLERIASLDRIMCGDDVTLVAATVGQLDLASTRQVLAGRVEEGMRGWGVRPDRVRTLLDPARVLAFHTLVEELKSTGKDEAACVAGATLVARRAALA